MVTLTVSGCPMSMGSRITSMRSFSASAAASSTSVSGSTSTNSSPPQRPMWSIERMFVRIRLATRRRTMSPAWCSQVSLIDLKWSMSRKATESGRPNRLARATSSVSASWMVARLGMRVSVSVVAASWVAASCSAMALIERSSRATPGRG